MNPTFILFASLCVFCGQLSAFAALLLAHMEKTEDPQTANFKKALAEWKAGRN